MSSPAYLPPLSYPVRMIGGSFFDFSGSIAIMGVVNVTPDSFYQRDITHAAGIARATQMIADGADIIDVGGAPFAPGPAVEIDEERARITPVVRELAEQRVAVSVDTFHGAVAADAIQAGATIINDTSGLWDDDLVRVVAEHPEVQLVITHSLAASCGDGPRTHFGHPQYGDVALDVTRFLSDRVEYALELGVRADQIMIDGGHDLNKSTVDSLSLTQRYSTLAELGHPLLSAVSRKDFVGETLDRVKSERLAGSLAAAVYTMCQGARIVRTHDIAEMKDAAGMAEAILGLRLPHHQLHNTGHQNIGEPEIEAVRSDRLGSRG